MSNDVVGSARLEHGGRVRVMTHAEYDREDWAEGCNCYRPQPKTPKKRRGER